MKAAVVIVGILAVGGDLERHPGKQVLNLHRFVFMEDQGTNGERVSADGRGHERGEIRVYDGSGG